MDIGAGDGRFALAHARAHPAELVIAIDASRDAMVDASRRASRTPKRGGAPNLVCVVAGAEALPDELAGVADLLTIHFPWGSLLRGAAGGDPVLTARLAGLVGPVGRVQLLLSTARRDAGGGLSEIDPAEVAAAWCCVGLEPTAARRATFTDADEVGSSWGRRLLRVPAADRDAWRLEFRRPAPGMIGP